ncbi:hypothetical protein [Streptomyces mutabilis]|uniref:hypothetical protein n=1 Tax=Streptomyces mutabilis TaxID=67332 RepID=UPI0036C19D0E
MRQLIRPLLGSDDPCQLRPFPALAFFPPSAQPPHADIRQRTNPTNQMEDKLLSGIKALSPGEASLDRGHLETGT